MTVHGYHYAAKERERERGEKRPTIGTARFALPPCYTNGVMLKSREVGELAKALNVVLSHGRLGKFVQIDEDVLSFSLTRGRRLVFVLYPEDPSCYLSSSPLGLTSLSTPLSQYFRKELGGASILSVSQAGEDRVLLFSLLVVNDVFQEERRTLVLELLPHHPNLLLLDEEYKILFVKKPSPSLLEKRRQRRATPTECSNRL